MVHFRPYASQFQWPVIQFAIASLFAVTTPGLLPAPASANNYSICSSELLDAGLSPGAVADACATALHPEDVSACVLDVIYYAPSIAPEAALSACSRDRRPLEVATCVGDIQYYLAVEDADIVLDRCHRSILPEQYSACVVGLSEGFDIAADDAAKAEPLEACIAAGFRPENLAPTFIFPE